MSDMHTEFFAGLGGAQLALHRMGSGRPLVLLHGLFSNAETNWIKFGTAARIAAAGYEVLMPDLRGHGQSAAPHDVASYPADVLVDDLRLLIEELKLDDYDLGGFSLGARTVVRGVLAGLEPRRLVISGMGLEGLSGWQKRQDFFLDVIARADELQRGDPAFMAAAFLKTMKIDRVAAAHLLRTMEDTAPASLSGVTMPTLVICGSEDQDNGSAPALAEALPDARYQAIPGTHMTSVTQRDLGEGIAAFLKG